VPPVHGLFDRARACRSTSDAPSTDTRLGLPFGRSRPCREVLPRSPPRQRRPPLPDQSAFPRQVPSRSSIVSPPLAQSTADFTRSSKTRHRVPASPPRTGFGRRFHPSHLTRTSLAWLPKLARHLPSAPSPVDVCNPNSLRAQPRTFRALVEKIDAARSARAKRGGDLRTGLGPRRLIDRRFQVPPCSSTRPSFAARAPVQTRRQPGFHEHGGRPTSGATIASRAACAVLAYARPRDIDPSPIRPSTSCRGRASISVGSRHRRSMIRRSRSSIRPFRLTVGTPHMSSARSSVAPVRYACAHRPTCLIRCSRQARPGPNGHPRVLARVIERVAPGTSGTVERRSRSRSLPPWAQGPTPPAAPRRAARFIDTRGAFRRWVTLRDEHRGLRPVTAAHIELAPDARGEALSTVCHQPVENARRLL
jgi:hypothetical protein